MTDTQVTWLTEESYDRLKAELDQLIANRPVIAAEINDWWARTAAEGRHCLLGAYSLGKAQRLLALLDPEIQTSGDPVYGDAAYSDGISRAGLMKNFNEFHDVRGHEQFVASVSKVQQDLMSTNVDADIEALLAFISSL